MSSREEILGNVRASQPEIAELPELEYFNQNSENPVEKFLEMATLAGSQVYEINDVDSGIEQLKKVFPEAKKVISSTTGLSFGDSTEWLNSDPHTLADVDLFITSALLGVAENGAIWLTDKVLGQRIAPTVNEHLAVFLSKETIVVNMHEAYDKTAEMDYGYGLFLGGPSKTADIEQILVLGAHGARSMHILLLP